MCLFVFERNHVCMFVCVCVCVRACVRACVRVCARAYVRVCVRVCVVLIYHVALPQQYSIYLNLIAIQLTTQDPSVNENNTI